MTLDEMRLAVCEKLPELIDCSIPNQPCWLTELFGVRWSGEPIHWPTEGLQVCHEAEKLLSPEWHEDFVFHLSVICGGYQKAISATYEQRLEALCRVWFPERFL